MAEKLTIHNFKTTQNFKNFQVSYPQYVSLSVLPSDLEYKIPKLEILQGKEKEITELISNLEGKRTKFLNCIEHLSKTNLETVWKIVKDFIDISLPWGDKISITSAELGSFLMIPNREEFTNHGYLRKSLKYNEWVSKIDCREMTFAKLSMRDLWKKEIEKQFENEIKKFNFIKFLRFLETNIDNIKRELETIKRNNPSKIDKAPTSPPSALPHTKPDYEFYRENHGGFLPNSQYLDIFTTGNVAHEIDFCKEDFLEYLSDLKVPRYRNNETVNQSIVIE